MRSLLCVAAFCRGAPNPRWARGPESGGGRRGVDVPAQLALPATRGARAALLLTRLLALLVCGLGALVLLGWRFDVPQLTEALPSLLSMKPNAAAGVLAGGFALLCFTFRTLRPVARLIGFCL